MIETISLLKISTLHQSKAKSELFMSPLTILHISTWSKWVGLALCFALIVFIIRKRNGFSIGIALLLSIPLALSILAFFGGPQFKDIFAASIFGAFGIIIVYCLIYKTKQTIKTNRGPIQIQLPEVLNMKSVNSWLFKAPIPTLVDCGEYTADSWNTLKMRLKEHGLEIKDIQKIVITHAHVDHMGMANQIVQESGAQVYLSEYAHPWGEHVNELWSSRSQIIKETFLELVGPESPIHGFFSTGQSFFDSILTMWEPIPKEHVVKFESKDGIDIGGRQWEVIYAPGHSSTQTVFFDRDSSQLLSADMLLNIAPTPVIELDPLKPGTRQPGLPKLIESFGTMKSLNISKAFPGHYDAFESVSETIDRQVNRIEMRTQHCHELIKQGCHNFHNLFLKMYPNRMHFPALVMMIGYLDVLEERGLISKEKDKHGVFRFEIS